MSKKLSVSLCSFLVFSTAMAADYSISGNIENKFINYTENSSKNLGYYTYFKIEQKTKFSSNFIAINQFRANSQSIESDLATKVVVSKKAIFDGYLGENYLRYQPTNFIIQAGFQEVVWGESFGFNYADIINPKDNRITFYSDKDQTRIPILLLNTKYFFPDGSIQFLYSPQPKFSKTLPIDLFTGDLLPQNTIVVNNQKTPNFFNENEFGTKFSISFSGLDLSLSYFDHLDRDPYYSTQSANLTSIYINENHSRIKSSILSAAKTLFDFVLRTDLVYTQNKTFNYFDQLTLSHYQSSTKEILISIDSPTINKFTGYLIFAGKKLDQFRLNSFNPENENYIISKLTYNLGEEKNLDFSYTRELNLKGNSIQGLLNLPVNNTTEIRIGGEFYFGDTTSNFSKIKKMNNIFFGIKNYFKI